MDQPQQNVPQYPAVGGQGYSSSQLQPQPQQQMSVPVYVAPPQGQSNSSGGPSPCCGCMPLKTACYVIGSLGIVISILLGLALGFILLLPHMVGNNGNPLKEEDKRRWYDLHLSIITIDIDVMVKMLLVVDAVQFIYVIFNIILVCGASSENANFCMTWIIAAVTCSIFRFIGNLLIFGVGLLINLLDLWFIIVVVYYVKELNKKKTQGQAQAFIPPTQVPSMIQPTGAYSNSNVGPPPPYSQTQSAALLQRNPAGPGQTYPSPGYPGGQSY